MKQKFSPSQYQAFKKYFHIQDTPGEWDIKYINKTKKYLKYISWIPGILLIGVGNSLSMNVAQKSSDIDLFIITKNNNIWLVRILVTVIFQILGVRKTAKKHAGRFCLSFFCSLDGMDFSNFALEQDIYLYFWIIHFKPLYIVGDTYKQFIEANRSWADFNASPFGYTPRVLPPYVQDRPFQNEETQGNQEKNLPLLKESSELGDGWIRKNMTLNGLLKNIFLPKTKKAFENLGKPFGVIISDDMLKFHDKDIRKQVIKDLL